MSKAPKTKKSTLHYQPYQALGSGETDEPSMDLNMSDLPLQMDPVLSGLSSNMSRNLWDDWNENDANFGLKFDMFTDEVSSTASLNPSLHVSNLNFELQNDASSNTIPSQTTSNHEELPNSRANLQRSLSEDIVNMLEESNEVVFTKQMEVEQRRDAAMQNMLLHPANGQKNMMNLQQQMHPNPMQQLQQMQQFQQFQQIGSSWMNNFENQTTATANTSSNSSIYHLLSHSDENATALEIAVAEGTASLTAKCPNTHSSATTATSSANSSSSEQPAPKRGKFGLPVSSPQKNKENPGIVTSNGVDANSGANGTNIPAQSQVNGMGMIPNPFMMYPMMNPQGMMQMSMGMNGMQLPMQMQLQLQLQMQMQMAQLAQMNGMGAMQMPMGLPGMSMNMNMQMPMKMNLQQHQVNPQSGLTSDVEMTSVQMAATAAPTLKRVLQPKGVRTGPGFVNIARKPEEPEMSSILKSLMDEEAKKKEKKLERNRDSARESRKKQQTYVETLENGIKRLQINRDLVRSYRWGVSGPGFGPLPCPNSPQMFDWKNRLQVVTGHTEAFSSIQNPANFESLMCLNRQRCTLSMHHGDRELAIWKSFVFVGRQLAALRTRVLQVQVLRTFSNNALAMELDAELQLSADQKLQMQCHAQQMFKQEVVELSKLFKIFFALRNEALRLNILSPTLERHFREICSFDQLQRLLHWSESHRTVIETNLPLDEV